MEAAREGHPTAQRCSSAEWRPLPGQEPLVVPDGMRVPKARIATVATRPKQDKDKAMPPCRMRLRTTDTQLQTRSTEPALNLV